MSTRVFLSYSHDSEQHVRWVLELAATLHERADVDPIVDYLSYDRSIPLSAFMVREMEDAEFVLLVCTQRYKEKAESLESTSGVGTEAIITLQQFYENAAKFLPVMRERTLRGDPAIPYYLRGYQYFDLSSGADYDEGIVSISRVIRGIREYELETVRRPLPLEVTRIAPKPLGASPDFTQELAANGERIRRDYEGFFRIPGAEVLGGTYPFIEPRLSPRPPDRASGDANRTTGATARDLLAGFLATKSDRVWLVLGDYGSGKTSFAYYTVSRLTSQAAYGPHGRWLPLFLAFRAFPDVLPDDMDAWLQGTLHGRYGATDATRFSWSVQTAALKEFMLTHDVVLVIDGMDECKIDVGGVATDSWSAVLRYLLALPCKAIVTSRTNYFPSATAVALDVWRVPFSVATIADMRRRIDGVRVDYLTEFDDYDVRDYVEQGPLPAPSKALLLERLSSDARLRELARKPVFAHLMVAQSDLLPSDDRHATTALCKNVILNWVDTHRRLLGLGQDELSTFLGELAFLMFIGNRREIDVETVRRYLALRFGPERAAQAEIDVTQSTVLVRTGDDRLAFSHNVLLEFLVALKLSEELSRFDNRGCYVRLLTEATNEFLIELLEDSATTNTRPYRGRTEDLIEVDEDLEFNRIAEAKVGGFMIGKYPVTQMEYTSFLADNPHMIPPVSEQREVLEELSRHPHVDWFVRDVDGYIRESERLSWDPDRRRSPDGQEEWPVVYVSYFDAWAYCLWAGCSLPTFLEWVKAAAWDSASRQLLQYPMIEKPDPGMNCNCAGVVGSPVPVGRYSEAPSAYGCVQMLGNVAEWTADWSDSRRIYRYAAGGSWHMPLVQCHTSSPTACFPNVRRNFVGFRTVVRADRRVTQK